MRVLVLGATGFVGSVTAERLREAAHEVLAVARSLPVGVAGVSADLSFSGAGEDLVAKLEPDAVVLLAAVPDIAPAREDPALARSLNAVLPGEVAGACARLGARLVHVSTDQVFDGTRGGWTEDDEPRPRHVYGETKRDGERAVLAADPGAVVVRLGLVTGAAPEGRRSCSTGLMDALSRGETPAMFTDETRSPIAVHDVARALTALVGRRELCGLLHYGGPEALTRHELARRELQAAGKDPALLGATTRAAVGLAEERPADLSLANVRPLAEVLPEAADRSAIR